MDKPGTIVLALFVPVCVAAVAVGRVLVLLVGTTPKKLKASTEATDGDDGTTPKATTTEKSSSSSDDESNNIVVVGVADNGCGCGCCTILSCSGR